MNKVVDLEDYVNKMYDDNIDIEDIKNLKGSEDIFKLLQSIEYIDENDEETIMGIASLEHMLELEDDKFEVLSETFLKEFEKSLNSNSEVFALISKQQNLDEEQIGLNYQAARQEIEESNLSEVKKDFMLRFVSLLFNAVFKNADEYTKILSIPYELCREGAVAPTYANKTDAGMDIYAPEEYTIPPGDTIIIPTGIKCAVPQGYALLIQPRSGQSAKTKLRIANTPGLIDSGYRDEIGVIVENIEPKIKDIEYEFNDDGSINIKSVLYGDTYTITQGQRFAQMRLVEAPTAALFPVSNIGEIEGDRGGGFGSSGTN